MGRKHLIFWVFFLDLPEVNFYLKVETVTIKNIKDVINTICSHGNGES